MKVLVAIDSSSCSQSVLEAVTKRTWPADTEIRILTLVESCHQWDAAREFLHQSQVILDHRVASVQGRLPDIKVIGELMEGSAKLQIVKTARLWEADLIIVGSHGDTGVRRSGIGSVAAAVVNRAPCSIEVIKVPSPPGATSSKKASKPKELAHAGFSRKTHKVK